MKKLIAMMLALVTGVSMLTGCAQVGKENGGSGSSTTSHDASMSEQGLAEHREEPYVFYWVRGGEETSLNPHQANITNNSDITEKIFATLYSFIPAADGRGARIVPDLAAAEPECVDDGYTWNIRIHPDARWQNGEKITAYDFEYSYQMQLDPVLVYQAGPTLAADFLQIHNAMAYYKQGAANDVKWEDVGIRAIAEDVLQVVSDQKQTVDDVMRHFNHPSTAPVYRPMYEAMLNADKTACEYGADAEKIMCSGKFLVESWAKGTEIVLVKNPGYLHSDWIHIDKIISRMVVDESTRLELFEKGEADFVALGVNGMAKYGEDPRVLSSASTAIETIEVNQNNPDKPWLKDPMFRKAMFYAVDRNAIAKLNQNMAAPFFLSVAGQALPDGTLYRDLPEAQAIVPENGGYNPELAREYMAQVMEKYNLDKVEINLMYTEGGEARRVASEYLQSDMERIFGADRFHMSLSANSFSLLNSTMRSSVKAPTNAWDLCWSCWAIYAEKCYPWKKMERYSSFYSRRYTTYSNAAMEELYQQCMLEENRMDPEKTAALTVEMEKAMYEDMTCVPVYQRLAYTLFADKVDLPMEAYNVNLGFGWIFSRAK